MSDLWQMPMATLSRMLMARNISAVELLDHYVYRLEQINPRLNALVTFDQTAHQAAQDSDNRRARQQSLGLLDGIPVAIKDNILTRGLKTTWGSPAYAEFVPEIDEVAVGRLKAAGAIVIGKTNVPEFTIEGFTDNALFGPTRNPWNPEATPGGSSGGSVAGVAAGLFPVALGTDGGGSIRRPCGYTGLFGLKPSIGRVARTETLPQILMDMEVIGPISRTVSDAAMIFEIISGSHLGDPRSWLPAEPNNGEGLHLPPAPLRILYVERFGAAPLDPEIQTSCKILVQQFEELGHHVEQGELPLDITELNAVWSTIGMAGLACLQSALGVSFSKASAKYRNLADNGRSTDAGEFYAICDLIANLRRQAAVCFDTWDIIVTPSSAAMPWPIGTDYPPEINGQKVGPRGHAIYTGWVNAIGHPAVSIPGPRSVSGQPIGAQLIAGFNRDRLLLRLAKQFEDVCPWDRQWPEIANTGTIQ